MRSGIAPAVLLFLALGLALTFAPRRAWVANVFALCAMLAVFVWLPVPPAWLDAAFFGSWISVIVMAAAVHLRRGVSARLALALSLNAGVWAGAAASVSDSRLAVLKVLPSVLIFFPGWWVTARFGSIPIKVVSSWIIAIAVLAGTLQLLAVTPGYLPDHLE